MTAGRYDLAIDRGDDWTEDIQLSVGDDDETAEPISVSTSGWTAQIRATPDHPDAVDIDVDASRGAEGILTLSLTRDQTTGLRDGGWDLQCSEPTVTTWLRGRVTVVKDYTHG